MMEAASATTQKTAIFLLSALFMVLDDDVNSLCMLKRITCAVFNRFTLASLVSSRFSEITP
jgi:hypothetical protein